MISKQFIQRTLLSSGPYLRPLFLGVSCVVTQQKRSLVNNGSTQKFRKELEKRTYSSTTSSTSSTNEKEASYVPQSEIDDFNATNIENAKYAPNNVLLKLAITERASRRLNSIAENDKNPNVALRIGVESGGCHGFQYLLKLTDLSQKTEDDCLLVRDGAKVLIDESSLQILRDSKVDYTNELIGSQFKVVDSPYTSSACGCGSSFDFDFSKLEQ